MHHTQTKISKASAVKPASVQRNNPQAQFVQAPYNAGTVPQYTRSGLRWRLGALSVATAYFVAWALQMSAETAIRGTPLFKGTMFALRQDPQVRQWVGDNVECTSHKTVAAWVRQMLRLPPQDAMQGYVNHLRGRAHLQFIIEGTQGKGAVEIEAQRQNDGGKEWLVKQLTVQVADETIVHVKPQVEP